MTTGDAAGTKQQGGEDENELKDPGAAAAQHHGNGGQALQSGQSKQAAEPGSQSSQNQTPWRAAGFRSGTDDWSRSGRQGFRRKRGSKFALSEGERDRGT